MRWQRWGHKLDVVVVVFWAAVVGLSLLYNLTLYSRQATDIALARARMLFNVIENVRLWNARHGGVYVQADAETPPNEYIKDFDRDFTVNGKRFTKVNPAYMTRQLAELIYQKQDLTFHITSLRPIRPQNGADPWESAMLARFDKGEREVIQHVADGAGPAFRYMAALVVSEPCLACHRQQGYAVGDVRGGISVTIPEYHVLAELAPQRRLAIALHAVAFGLFSLGSLLFLSRMRRNWAALVAAKAEQERMVVERTAELRAEMAERERIAERLARTVGELERSNEELESFAYAASHDLQEPLRMVRGYAQMVASRYADRLDDDGRDCLGFLADGAERMKRMIDDLLAYSRVEQAPAGVSAVKMDWVLERAQANLAAAIDEAGARIEAAPLPRVAGDASLLSRLMQNLLGNAIKYRDPIRPPLIRVSAERVGERWQFTVADNGVGLPEEGRGRLFQLFQRLHDRSRYQGTGIGLATCRKIVERHGGTIWVESRSGQGAEFHFTLPAAPDDTG